MLCLDAREHEREHAVAQLRRVDEREEAQGAGRLQPPHARAHGALRDADLACDVAERPAAVVLQRLEDLLVGLVERDLRHAQIVTRRQLFAQ